MVLASAILILEVMFVDVGVGEGIWVDDGATLVLVSASSLLS